MNRVAGSDAFKAMHEEIDRRMGEATDAILREHWPAYGVLTAAGASGELEQVISDTADTAKLNQPDLLAEYLEVMVHERVEVPRSVSRPIADKLIAKRREIELEALEHLGGLPGMPPVAQRQWSLVTRIAAGVLIVFFLLLAIGFALPAGKTATERFGPSAVLIAIDAVLLLVFFGSRFRVSKSPEDYLKRQLRLEIEDRFARVRAEGEKYTPVHLLK